MKPAWYILKRGHELRNSLAGGTGKTLFGAATTVVYKRNNKRSIGIMIFLMEAVLASIFWLEDAPINTTNTIYVIYTLRNKKDSQLEKQVNTRYYTNYFTTLIFSTGAISWSLPKQISAPTTTTTREISWSLHVLF